MMQEILLFFDPSTLLVEVVFTISPDSWASVENTQPKLRAFADGRSYSIFLIEI